jgi:hypothetical protein
MYIFFLTWYDIIEIGLEVYPVGPLTNRSYEIFAQGLAYGFSPSSAAENAGLEVTDTEAAHLSTDPEVQARVTELLSSQHFDPSLEHLRVARQLEVDRDFAYRMGNPAAAINATVNRAKVLGVFVERIISDQNVAVRSGKELTPEEWAAKFGQAPHPSKEETE